jgi:hypothetical protein
MKRLILFVLSLWICTSSISYAQDDLYFVPSKKKAKEQRITKTEESEYRTIARKDVMDVDTYNRWGKNDKSTQPNDTYAEEDDNEAGTYTARIVRFHAPGVTYVSSPFYGDYIDVYADPWYYSSYDYFYHSPYSWHWHLGWGGSYAWNDYWWHHSWHHHYAWHHSWHNPFWGHHWHPGYHHPSYHPPHVGPGHKPSKPTSVAHRRPNVRDNYRPSTQRASSVDSKRSEKRPSSNRVNQQNDRKSNTSTQRQQSNKKNNEQSVRNNRSQREQRQFGSPSNSRSERSFSQPSRSSRPAGGSGGGGGRGRR